MGMKVINFFAHLQKVIKPTKNTTRIKKQHGKILEFAMGLCADWLKINMYQLVFRNVEMFYIILKQRLARFRITLELWSENQLIPKYSCKNL